jgi:hypothetical protein
VTSRQPLLLLSGKKTWQINAKVRGKRKIVLKNRLPSFPF